MFLLILGKRGQCSSIGQLVKVKYSSPAPFFFAGLFNSAISIDTIWHCMMMINECEVGGMRTGRETKVFGETLLQCHFIHHEFHMT
jgi:hypothetical protein